VHWILWALVHIVNGASRLIYGGFVLIPVSHKILPRGSIPNQRIINMSFFSSAVGHVTAPVGPTYIIIWRFVGNVQRSSITEKKNASDGYNSPVEYNWFHHLPPPCMCKLSKITYHNIKCLVLFLKIVWRNVQKVLQIAMI